MHEKKLLILLTIISLVPSSLVAPHRLQTAGISSILGAAMGTLVWKYQHNKWKEHATDEKTEPKWYKYVWTGAVLGAAVGTVGKWGIDYGGYLKSRKEDSKSRFEEAWDQLIKDEEDLKDPMVRKALIELGCLNHPLCLSKLNHFKVVSHEDGFNVNANDYLHQAALNGELASVDYLVGIGADVNKQDGNGSTPLHYAAMRGKLDIVDYLVQKGAGVNVRDARGCTPLMYAVPCKGVVERLVAFGANPLLKDTNGSTAADRCDPTHFEVRKECFDLLKKAEARERLQEKVTLLCLMREYGDDDLPIGKERMALPLLQAIVRQAQQRLFD